MYLNCKTYFSFRYGTIPTQEQVQTAAELGITALALTNINNTCDIWDFVKYCNEAGIKPIAGVEIRNQDDFLYILLATNNNGLQWIHEFVSAHLLHKKPFPAAVNAPAFFDNPADGFVIYPLEAKPLEALYINERIGILPWELNQLFAIDLKTSGRLLVIRQPVTVQNKRYHNLHRLLR